MRLHPLFRSTTLGFFVFSLFSLSTTSSARAAFVCIKRQQTGVVSSQDFKRKKIPARYQYIEWRAHPDRDPGIASFKAGEVLAVGYTDELGDWHTDLEATTLDAQYYSADAKGLCADIIVPGGTIHTQVRLRPLAPEGNTNWTRWINIPGFTPGTNKTDIVYLKPPTIKEKIRKNPFANDIPVRRSLPLYATHDFFKKNDPLNQGAVDRVAWDSEGQKRLVINTAKTPNTEGLHAYKAPDPNGYNLKNGERDLAKTHADLNDGGGVIVLRSLDLKYDYESCGDYLINELYPDAAWFGLNDCLAKGMYSNTKIFLVEHDALVSELGNDDNICKSRVTELESAFKRAVEKVGGINGGMVPGYFWSGSTTLSEQFNSAHTIRVGFDPKRYSVGKSYYTNLPLWDVDDLGTDKKLALLLIESDDNKKNDVITCNDNINLAEIVTNQGLMITNRDFIAGQPAYKDHVLADFIGEETALLEIGYETSVDTYLNVQNPEKSVASR